MPPPLLSRIALPPGTTIAFEDPNATMVFTWRSAAGIHIVSSVVPAIWFQEGRFESHLAEAARVFKRTIAREMLDEFEAAKST